MIVFLLDRLENIVGKGENAVDQHFLLFPQCFGKATSISLGSLKVGIVWKRVKYFEQLINRVNTFFQTTKYKTCKN